MEIQEIILENGILTEDQVIFDRQDYLLKISDIELRDTKFSLKNSFEIKNADIRYLGKEPRSILVNGVHYDGVEYYDLDFGNLKKCGLAEFTVIAYEFKISNPRLSSNEQVCDHKIVHIFPFGKEKYAKFERSPKPTDIIIFDNEYAKGTVVGYEQEEEYAACVQVYFENKSERDMEFKIDGSFINDVYVNPFDSPSLRYAIQVNADSSRFETLGWAKDSLSENNIEAINNIKIEIRVSQHDKKGHDFCFKGTCTIKS